MHLNKLAYTPTIENRQPRTPKRSELILTVCTEFLFGCISWYSTENKSNTHTNNCNQCSNYNYMILLQPFSSYTCTNRFFFLNFSNLKYEVSKDQNYKRPNHLVLLYGC